MANQDKHLEIIRNFLQEKGLTNLDWGHICNCCWNTKTLGDPENHFVKATDGYDRPVCPECLKEPSISLQDPPKAIMKLFPAERDFDGRRYETCHFCRLRPGEWCTFFNHQKSMLCTICVANVEICAAESPILQGQLSENDCIVFATSDIGDGAMRCQACIQDIAAGEHKIQDEALVTLAKGSCSKFDNAWAMWEKELGDEKTRQSVVDRARIIRRALSGPKVWYNIPPCPVEGCKGEKSLLDGKMD